MATTYTESYSTEGVSQANYYRVYAFKIAYNLNSLTHVGNISDTSAATDGSFAFDIDPTNADANYYGELGSCDAAVAFTTSDSDGTANNRGSIIGDKKTGELAIPVNTPSNISRAFAKKCTEQSLNYVFLNVETGECFLVKEVTAKLNRESTGGSTSQYILSASKEAGSLSGLEQDKTLLPFDTYGDPLTAVYAPATTYVVGDVVTPVTIDGSAYACVVGVAAAAEPTWNAKVGGYTGTTPEWRCIVGNTDEELTTA